MRELISVADYIVPNYTEAAYLTELPYKEDGVTEEAYHTMIDKLRAFGAKSIVITSAKIAGTDCRSVVGYDHKKEEYFKVDFEEIPVHFPGTGDIFSAVFIGKLTNIKVTGYNIIRIGNNICCFRKILQFTVIAIDVNAFYCIKQFVFYFTNSAIKQSLKPC